MQYCFFLPIRPTVVIFYRSRYLHRFFSPGKIYMLYKKPDDHPNPCTTSCWEQLLSLIDKIYRLMWGNPRQSGFYTMDSGFQVQYWITDNSLSVEHGFRIRIIGGIPDSLGCIPDSKARIPDFTTKMYWIPDVTSQTFLDSGIRIPEWGEIFVEEIIRKERQASIPFHKIARI